VISGVVTPEVNTSTAPIPNRPTIMTSALGLLAPFVAKFLATYPAITIEIDVSVRIADLIGKKAHASQAEQRAAQQEFANKLKRGMAVFLE